MSRIRAVAGAPEGGLVVDKPAGPTSHDVVAVARRALGQPRIGHTGTLDPLATGVLPLLLGRATRLAQFLASTDKTYFATIQFGQATSSYDAAGEPAGPLRPVALDPVEVEAALARFRGRQMQVPPAVSAKKVGGHRAYDLARRDQPVDLAAVEVSVTDMTLVSCAQTRAQVRVTCSAGFYVRSLAHDLGIRLGVGAHLAALRRERSGGFTLAESVGLDRLTGAPADVARLVRPMADLLPDWPALALSEDEAARIGHGQALAVADRPDGGGHIAGRLRLIDQRGHLVALAEERAGFLHPVLVLV
ncbi:MAG: tRNA pseudouridine(55) synthase TruB [Vicinamibacteria bacterium]|nr:tRNA pseudouridine(55) synthase TruB [Vicinamibacteria bacterium]